ncbi:MAG: hypothetical protein KDI18_09295 [Gammaproteobacteria bacterium]|nr:hypothetical protein [Gammaproteobacteria bacterium]
MSLLLDALKSAGERNRNPRHPAGEKSGSASVVQDRNGEKDLRIQSDAVSPAIDDKYELGINALLAAEPELELNLPHLQATADEDKSPVSLAAANSNPQAPSKSTVTTEAAISPLEAEPPAELKRTIQQEQSAEDKQPDAAASPILNETAQVRIEQINPVLRKAAKRTRQGRKQLVILILLFLLLATSGLLYLTDQLSGHDSGFNLNAGDADWTTASVEPDPGTPESFDADGGQSPLPVASSAESVQAKPAAINAIEGGDQATPSVDASHATNVLTRKQEIQAAAEKLLEEAGIRIPTELTGAPLTTHGSRADVAAAVPAEQQELEQPTQLDEEIGRITIKKRQVRNLEQARLTRGYAALRRRELEKAALIFKQNLKGNPDSIKGVLGLASVAEMRGDAEQAERLYRKVLQIEPGNLHAITAIIQRGAGTDPVRKGQQLDKLIERHPVNADLRYLKGNLHASNQRWREAQADYFKALELDGTNPDYAYNLAISLEHIGQPSIALTYYRLALELAQNRNARFAPEQVRTRIEQIQAGGR